MNRLYYIRYGWKDYKGDFLEAEKDSVPTREEAEEIAAELKDQGYEVEISYERI